LRSLQGHDWPGNVRELRNAVERAVALCPGDVIDVEDLPPALAAAAPGPDAPGSPAAPAAGVISLARSKGEAEAACIAAAWGRHNNNRLRAAAELGISRMTLYKKLHRYGLIAAEGA